MSGGGTARRAVARWAWRSFRRDWKAQVLLVALLTIAVAASTFSAAAVYNVTPGRAGTFGSAGARITFENDDPAATAADIAAARGTFGTVDVITSRSGVVAGRAEPLELRTEDPHGAFVGPMLALRSGRYPTAPNEIALTADVSRTTGAPAGGELTIDGHPLTVVGIVENPGHLDEEFGLVTDTYATRPEVVTLLVAASSGQVEAFRSTMTVPGNVLREMSGDERKAAAVYTFMLTTIGLLLVALIAAAAFLVLAQRRLRSLGMLAAVGASERQVRLVTMANGAIVGLVAATIGTAAGLAAWGASITSFEHSANHRITGLSVPVWIVATSVVLAITTAVASAWWPARIAARVPVVEALSNRPPRPRSTHLSAALAIGLVAAGELCFALAHQHVAALLVMGTALATVGVLLVAPAAVRATGRLAARLPIAGRLALRDLARYQTRSAAALAAISLALGAPVAIVVVANAASHSASAGNLAANQMLLRIGSAPKTSFIVREETAEQLAQLDSRVDGFVAALHGATSVPLDMAVNPNMPVEPGLTQPGELEAVQVAWQAPNVTNRFDAVITYVATPELLRRLQHDAAASASHDLYADEQTGKYFFLTPDFLRADGPVSVADVAPLTDPRYSSLPHTLVSPAFVESQGWTQMRAGWLIETAQPFTDAQRAAALDLAASAGLNLETRDTHASLSQLRVIATVVGMLLALGVLAMSGGLIRGEAAADLRVLAATGASSVIRRRLTAATAGVLALLGVLLGVAGAYAVLFGAYLEDLSRLLPIPVANLAVIVTCVPLLAAATGWLLAGRPPPVMSRAAID